MAICISILRGINVSGQKQIRMKDLETVYLSLGFNKVLTYIQSGNVIFMSDDNTTVKELSEKIETAIFDRFGFAVPVIIRTLDEMKSALEANPFKNADRSVPEKIYLTFLDKKPHLADVEKLSHLSFLPDRFIIIEKEVYLNCAGGYGTTKLSNTFFENKLKVKATTRNWNTVNKLTELASNIK